MTTKSKWLIVAGMLMAAGLAVVGVGVVAFFVLPNVLVRHPLLPKYQLEQVDSSHKWYRRTTVRVGSAVYVEDYEDYPLQLANVEPTDAISRAPFGDSYMCSIRGQSPSNYVAVDCGSEMPAYEVFRNADLPPFDWRHAKFQMMYFSSFSPNVNPKNTNDAALITEVVKTLSQGTPTTETFPMAEMRSNVCNVCLSSKELPGIMFCPQAYRDGSGAIYLAESMGMEPLNRGMKYHATWIPAGALFTAWVTTP